MVTVFTATYNRAYILGQLYNSLKNQTDFDFEWLIVDDGSTDNTKELVDAWARETKEFKIIYHPVKHGGVCRAINAAAHLAHSEAFLWIGSDDHLTPDAIAFVQKHFTEIMFDSSFAGMCVLVRAYTDGRLISGSPTFKDYVDATRWECQKYGLTGDVGFILKTSVLKRFPSPEFEGEDYLSPGVFLDALTHEGLKFRWFNHVAYLAEYLKDGITKNHSELYWRNPCGCAYYLAQERKFGFFPSDSKFRWWMFLLYERSKGKLCDVEIRDIFRMEANDFNGMLALYDAVKSEIAAFLQKNNTKTLALYGYGENARRLMCYLAELGITVSYIIDQNYEEKSFRPAYSLDMDLPPADSVCVTLAQPEQKIVENLKKKLPTACIWRLVDLKNKIWDSNQIFLSPGGQKGIWTW